VAEFWPVYAQSQAPAKWCPNGCAGYPDKLDIGAIRTVNGKTEIIYSRTQTEDNALSGEWIPFDGSNQAHCTAGSIYQRYGRGWSFGPVHNQHAECYGYYENVNGTAPTTQWWKDCDYNYQQYLVIFQQSCRKDGGKPEGNICRSGGESCGDGVCQAIETPQTCRADCSTTTPVCGNGKCEGNETTATCPGDCPPPLTPCPPSASCRAECPAVPPAASCDPIPEVSNF